jgi:hypothetical protein
MSTLAAVGQFPANVAANVRRRFIHTIHALHPVHAVHPVNVAADVRRRTSGFCVLSKHIEGRPKHLVQFVPETLTPDVAILRVRKILLFESEISTPRSKRATFTPAVTVVVDSIYQGWFRLLTSAATWIPDPVFR